MGIFEKLDELHASGALPMHMPGHKRNTGAFPWLAGLAERDITEIADFDNLNDPEGLFAGLERRLARLWGAGEAVALVNGSTLGVLAGIISTLASGGELLTGRQSHRSVYHACELAGAEIRYFTQPFDRDAGTALSVEPEEVARRLDEYPGVRLVCVTSPTYDGVISDIRSIAQICHAKGRPLMVDCAHGAHLGLPGFPEGCGRYADITVLSLHKTLPCLTQTAAVLINLGLVDPGRVRRYVSMLQTSSPSYLLSGAIDGCAEFLEREGPGAARTWRAGLDDLRARVSGLSNIRLFDGGGAFDYDPSKLLLRCDGHRLAALLREWYRIEPEYAARDRVLCMTGMGDSAASLTRLAEALTRLDPLLPPPPPAAPVPGIPVRRLSLKDAAALPGRLVPTERAAGRVSGEYVELSPRGAPPCPRRGAGQGDDRRHNVGG